MSPLVRLPWHWTERHPQLQFDTEPVRKLVLPVSTGNASVQAPGVDVRINRK